MDIKKTTDALYDWANDDKRSVLCIVSEVTEETDDDYGYDCTVVTCGRIGTLVDSLVKIMKDNDKVARMVEYALLKYNIGKHI